MLDAGEAGAVPLGTVQNLQPPQATRHSFLYPGTLALFLQYFNLEIEAFAFFL